MPIIIYGYTPSFALAVFAAAFFSISLAVHCWQVFRHRTWYFVTVPVALLFEIVGYVSRSLSARVDPYNLIFFVLNYFFIVTAPVFLSAGIYAVLSVLLGRLGGEPRAYCPLPPRAILAVFITSDVIATVLQITGAALIGSREAQREDPDIGNHILLGGLAWQVLSMAVYCVLLGTILWRARDPLFARHDGKGRGRGWGLFVATFVVATLMVYLRTCFRLAENAEGIGGYLSTHEVFFATLEFAPVALAALLFNLWHPGRCMPSREALKAPPRGPSETGSEE